jgi:hypothetical protein
MSDIYEKYPFLKDRKNAKLIRIKIAPINRPSNHEDGSLVLTREAANKLILDNKLSHMPIHYGSETHKKDGKYVEIGHILDAGEVVVEEGIEYLEADVILHEESQKDYVEEIMQNKDILGNSWELIPSIGYENNGITKIKEISDFIGNAILNKDYTAFDGTRIVYASKNSNQKESDVTKSEPTIDWENKYKELLVENDSLKKTIDGLRLENNSLWNRIDTEVKIANIYKDLVDFWKNKDSSTSYDEEPMIQD